MEICRGVSPLRESRLSQLVGDAERGQKSLDNQRFRAEVKISKKHFSNLKLIFFPHHPIDINRKPFRQFLPRVPFVEVVENWGYNLTCW